MTVAAQARIGRPRGEIRQVLASAAHALAREQGGATWRELAQRSGVGYQAARQTACNMVRAGELIVRERRMVPGSRRPMLILAPADPVVETTTAHAGLTAIVGGWFHARSPSSSSSAVVHARGERATAESTAAADTEG